MYLSNILTFNSCNLKTKLYSGFMAPGRLQAAEEAVATLARYCRAFNRFLDVLRESAGAGCQVCEVKADSRQALCNEGSIASLLRSLYAPSRFAIAAYFYAGIPASRFVLITGNSSAVSLTPAARPATGIGKFFSERRLCMAC